MHSGECRMPPTKPDTHCNAWCIPDLRSTAHSPLLNENRYSKGSPMVDVVRQLVELAQPPACKRRPATCPAASSHAFKLIYRHIHTSQMHSDGWFCLSCSCSHMGRAHSMSCAPHGRRVVVQLLSVAQEEVDGQVHKDKGRQHQVCPRQPPTKASRVRMDRSIILSRLCQGKVQGSYPSL